MGAIMQPDVMTRKHIKIIWITLAIVFVIMVVLYGYGLFVPSINPDKQTAQCEGAKNTLAELEKNPADAGASESKIQDARQLAETECSKS